MYSVIDNILYHKLFGERLLGLTGILIISLTDPHALGERSTRGFEPQRDSAGIHSGQIRAAPSSGSPT